jgi:hypothetical protein
MAWLPVEFVHPTEVALGDGHFHLRPIRASDVELDMPAVMGSRERLWSICGQAWGWPPAGMTAERDRRHLARHGAEADGHEAFNYAVLDASEGPRPAPSSHGEDGSGQQAVGQPEFSLDP